MEITVKGQTVAYDVAGAGQPLLLLHGWGVERSVFEALTQQLAPHLQVIRLDFPGFGASPPPETAWGVSDYADLVAAFCAQLGIDRPWLLGHSFGGRVSIVLGARSFTDKIVLTGAAGLIPKRKLSYYLRVYSYKAAKRIMRLPGLRRYYDRFLARWQKRHASSDYAQAQGVMRQIFVRVVNEDLKPYLPQITAPTLLLWGENDTETPLAFGQTMERLIPDSGLVVFQGAGHYPFLEQPAYFYRVLESFLQITT